MKYLGTGDPVNHVRIPSVHDESGSGLRQLAGTVADIKEGKAEVKSKKGNTISKNGTEDDPAVVIEREGVSRLHMTCEWG
jgi:hypothetical protein